MSCFNGLVSNKLDAINELCFKVNAKWWNTPGSLSKDNSVFTGYNRDEILQENPFSQKLISLNQYLITIDSQDSKNTEHDKGIELQRFYSQIILPNMELADMIVKKLDKECHWRIWNSKDCKSKQNYPNFVTMPLTINIEPPSKNIFVDTHFLSDDYSKKMSLSDNISFNSFGIFEDSALVPGFVSLCIMSKYFKCIEGFELPKSFKYNNVNIPLDCRSENITENIYNTIYDIVSKNGRNYLS